MLLLRELHRAAFSGATHLAFAVLALPGWFLGLFAASTLLVLFRVRARGRAAFPLSLAASFLGVGLPGFIVALGISGGRVLCRTLPGFLAFAPGTDWPAC